MYTNVILPFSSLIYLRDQIVYHAICVQFMTCCTHNDVLSLIVKGASLGEGNYQLKKLGDFTNRLLCG
jgi:hypothetical protein